MNPIAPSYKAKIKRTERKAKCKGCMKDPWSARSEFAYGEKRIVVTTGYGPSTRNISLCVPCAEHQLEMIRESAHSIHRAISILKGESEKPLQLVIGGAA